MTIGEQHYRVLHAILEWQHAEKAGPAQRLANARRKLRDLLSRRAPFTMLMRATEAVIAYVPPEFLD